MHGAIAFSTIPKGVITRIDTTAAEQAPGVIKVFTHLNAPAMKVPAPLSVGGEPSAGASDVKILNTDRISWNGQPVAVVVADTEERAEYAASLVAVTYAVEEAVTSFEAAITTCAYAGGRAWRITRSGQGRCRMRPCDRHRIMST